MICLQASEVVWGHAHLFILFCLDSFRLKHRLGKISGSDMATCRDLLLNLLAHDDGQIHQAARALPGGGLVRLTRILHQAGQPAAQGPGVNIGMAQPPPLPFPGPPPQRRRRCNILCTICQVNVCGRKDKPWKQYPRENHECRVCHRA